MDPPRIQDGSALDAAFDAPTFLLFKHSTRCPISARAFAAYQRFLEAHPEVPTAWIDVVRDRGLSLEAARRTGIDHQSPQAFVMARGRPTWHASHGTITEEALRRALEIEA